MPSEGFKTEINTVTNIPENKDSDMQKYQISYLDKGKNLSTVLFICTSLPVVLDRLGAFNTENAISPFPFDYFAAGFFGILTLVLHKLDM